jgi:hypothetical protein
VFGSDMFLSLLHRLVCTPTDSKSITELREFRIEYRTQYLEQGLLDQTIHYRWSGVST